MIMCLIYGIIHEGSILADTITKQRKKGHHGFIYSGRKFKSNSILLWPSILLLLCSPIINYLAFLQPFSSHFSLEKYSGYHHIDKVVTRNLFNRFPSFYLQNNCIKGLKSFVPPFYHHNYRHFSSLNYYHKPHGHHHEDFGDTLPSNYTLSEDELDKLRFTDNNFTADERELILQYENEVEEEDKRSYVELKKYFTYWPKDHFMRIKIYGHFKVDMNNATRSILKSLSEFDQFYVTGPVYLPSKKRRFTFLTAPTIDKDAREQFEIFYLSRLFYIYPKKYFVLSRNNDTNDPEDDLISRYYHDLLNGNNNTDKFGSKNGILPHKKRIEISKKDSCEKSKYPVEIKKMLLIQLPSMVRFECRYEHYIQPKKDKEIKSSYKDEWTSKFYTYNSELREKNEIVNTILDEKYKYDLLYIWPKSFHVLKKFDLLSLRNMLKRVKFNYEARLKEESEGNFMVQISYNESDTKSPISYYSLY